VRTCRQPTPIVRRSSRVPYNLLLRVNEQLVLEKVRLLEEIGQLKAAVHIYRDIAANTKRSQVIPKLAEEDSTDPSEQVDANLLDK
jgi:hypothetical protein